MLSAPPVPVVIFWACSVVAAPVPLAASACEIVRLVAVLCAVIATAPAPLIVRPVQVSAPVETALDVVIAPVPDVRSSFEPTIAAAASTWAFVICAKLFVVPLLCRTLFALPAASFETAIAALALTSRSSPIGRSVSLGRVTNMSAS